MENGNGTGRNRRKTEIRVLAIYTIYSASMIVMAAARGWESWIGFFLLAALCAAWIVSLTKYKDYFVRARFISIMTQISIFLYARQAENLTGGLPIFIAFVVFLGLFECLDTIYITFISAVMIFFYHGVIAGTLPLSNTGEILQLAAQVGNVATVELAVWFWVKKRNENSAHMQKIIDNLRAAESSKDEFLAVD